MANYHTAILLMLLVSSRALGGFTDFEDLTLGAIFTAGETIHSKELAFQSVGAEGGDVHVGDLGIAGGSGLELVLGSSSSGLDFLLPAGTRHVSMLFYSGSAAGFVVNGVASPLPADDDFDTLDGSIVGGVLVSATPLAPLFPRGHRRGELILQGDIGSLRFHGGELWIDNVQVAIPEPSYLAIFAGACVCWLCSRKK